MAHSSFSVKPFLRGRKQMCFSTEVMHIYWEYSEVSAKGYNQEHFSRLESML